MPCKALQTSTSPAPYILCSTFLPFLEMYAISPISDSYEIYTLDDCMHLNDLDVIAKVCFKLQRF